MYVIIAAGDVVVADVVADVAVAATAMTGAAAFKWGGVWEGSDALL